MNTRFPALRKVSRLSVGGGFLLAALALAPAARADHVWVEGEKPVRTTVTRHPPWYDKVQRDQLSGGDFLSHWNEKRPGEAEYRVAVPTAGEYEFWVRANPVQAHLAWKLNDGPWSAIDLDRDVVGRTNIAANRAIDLRFLAWVKVGKVTLRKGANTVHFRMDSKNHNHGMLDCFVFSTDPFRPRGVLRPGEAAKDTSEKGWFAFDPEPDPFRAGAGFDLRGLNEKEAGAGGFIGVKGGQFVHTATGRPVRFWGVNGPASKDRDGLRREARLYAKYGINLVRVHRPVFDERGEVDRAAVLRALDVVAAMKAEGIYCHFSIYFPLWLRPAPGLAWLDGYDGKQHPFAALYFNKDFQDRYRKWWQALLLTPSPRTGKRLIDEPAVAGLEIINEDSYFFWTFSSKNLPDPQLRILEARFGDWLRKKYGSLDGALKAWNGPRVARDDPARGRVGFRPLWNLANERTARDRDTARFLLESQRDFYRDTSRFLRELGFKGVITASNWATASPQVLGPLEKYSYTVGDFIDRHGYFGCLGRGPFSEWSIRDGHTYADRSALRFDPETPGKPRAFVHPAMDPSYDGKPSMISETTFTRPNRHRSEAPLFYAAYGALQDTDAIVHFALDGASWSVKPNFFMQPWTLMAPAMVGQFPAAAMIYRNELVAAGDLLVEVNLKVEDVLALRGTPLPQDAAFDELRLKDVPEGTTLKPGNVIDPLVHFAGRTNVNFTKDGGPAKLRDLARYIDRKAQVVRSSTGELRLDYGRGVLTIDAPAAQGVSGALRGAGKTELRDLTVASGLELGHVVAVSLDGKPLASSRRILLQVMSEEKPTDFRAELAGNGVRRIASIGHDPWQVRQIEGTVRFRRADAAALKVTALDHNGYPAREVGTADAITLGPRTLYYLITP